MKKRLFVVLVLIMSMVPMQIFAAPPSGKGGPSSDDGSTISYVALGDSIAYGTGATNDYGYVYHYRDYLKSNGTPEDTSDDVKVALTNKALRGMKTNDLLAQVKLDQGVRRAIKKANVVTVSIGGNNLLQCASDNYSYIDDSCAQQGVDNFKKDWAQIIDTIRSLNNTAVVKVLNLYNPYRDDSSSSTEKALYDQANGYIQTINDELTFVNGTVTYNIVDVYQAFSGTNDNGTFKVSIYTHFSKEVRDPHPTDEGHILIAELHYN